MDKLAMEEAEFHNCVSVPDGAPAVVSLKELPPEEKCRIFHKVGSSVNEGGFVHGESQLVLAQMTHSLLVKASWRVRSRVKTHGLHA